MVNDRARPLYSDLENLLVNLLGVLGRLLQETLVTNLLDVGLRLAGVGVDKVALVDEIASQLLVFGSWQRALGAEALYTVCQTRLGYSQVLLAQTLLVLRAVDDAHTGPAGIDVNGVVGGFLVEPDLKTFVVSGICGDLCGVERVDVADDSVTFVSAVAVGIAAVLTRLPSR